MVRGELLRRLLVSEQRGDREEFLSVALEAIAEEERKNNHRLARDLKRILENGCLNGPEHQLPNENWGTLPQDKERQVHLVEVRQPKRHMDEILLTRANGAAVERVLQEYRKAELLRVHGLRPSSKLLFCGPPGCGKTLCAEVIASELGLPLLYTRFDAIVSSYLGETAANLRRVFEYASNGQWVVLFDEFDAIGKARDNPTEHGELKRVINSFLQLLDSFVAPSIIIAATNHEQLLDPALWRRFDEIIVFHRPSVHEIRSLLTMKLRNFPRSGVDLGLAAPRLRGMSHADVERVCLHAVKTALLSDKDSLDQETFDLSVEQQRVRSAITAAASRRRHA